MITLSREGLEGLVERARLAPSVHNVQPSRWRLAGERLQLLGDPARAIPVADPEGRDWRLSHGAHFEGFCLALAEQGLAVADLRPGDARPGPDGLAAIADCAIASAASREPAEPVAARVSWRGRFKPLAEEGRAAVARLAAERDDCLIVRGQDAIRTIAALADAASLHFLREDDHRTELRRWLRLSRTDPAYRRDGLTADAMGMSPVEAWGAGLVLGPLFRPLDRIGLAAPLVSDLAKTRSAAALALFHRPRGEDAFVSGRAFYRAWLAMERQGLKACPISVLADWPASRETLTTAHPLPAGRALVNVFRVGVPDGTPRLERARLPVGELIV